MRTRSHSNCPEGNSQDTETHYLSQNLVAWPPLPARKTRKCSLYSGQPYAEVKTRIPVTKEERENGGWDGQPAASAPRGED